jgi:cell division protein FtsQ
MRPPKARASPIPLVPFRSRSRASAVRLLPSGRSLLIGFALLVSCVGAYVGARESSLFAVREIDIRGADPAVAADARAALRGEVGKSLLELDSSALERRLATIPTIRSARLDRAFPHTLIVAVNSERPVAVVRRGAEGWLVSSRGRILRTVQPGTFVTLPRIWLAKGGEFVVGSTLPLDQGGRAAAALGALSGTAFARRVLLVQERADELTFVLRSGVELRLGDAGDLRLKLAIGQRILALYGTGAPRGSYVDVSVPERPVADLNPQLEG